MTYRRGFQRKTKLTPLEKLDCAHLYWHWGLSQAELLGIFKVDQSLINEAINLSVALGLPRVNYDDD